MDIMELGAMGELLGGLAVIASLIYVGVQIRQGNTLARAQAQRDVNHSFQLALDRVAAHPVLFQRGLHDFDAMKNEEQLRFAMLLATVVNHLDQTLRMFHAGLDRGHLEERPRINRPRPGRRAR